MLVLKKEKRSDPDLYKPQKSTTPTTMQLMGKGNIGGYQTLELILKGCGKILCRLASLRLGHLPKRDTVMQPQVVGLDGVITG